MAMAGCGTTPSTKPEGPSNNAVINVQGVTGVYIGPAASGDAVIQFQQIVNAAVDTSAPAGPRHFFLGAVPIGAPGPNVTTEVLDNAIKFTARAADCFVIRQKVDWEAFRPGGHASPDFTIDILKLLDKARAAGFVRTLVEMDPIVDRHHVGPLPPAIAGEGFDGPNVRAAMKAQVLEVVKKGRPDYLSFGVEVNGLYESKPEEFANFVQLHKELYDEVKAVAPDTVVMASMNLEAIQGLLSGLNDFSTHGPQWFLIDMFEPKLDAVAFSTLPFPVFYRPVQIPANYISQIQDHTTRPIVLSEIGWTTSLGAGSDQTQQQEYVAIMARQAMRTPQLQIMAWTIFFDADDGSIFDLYPSFKFLGLLSAGGDPKPAFATWTGLYQNPYVPPGGS